MYGCVSGVLSTSGWFCRVVLAKSSASRKRMVAWPMFILAQDVGVVEEYKYLDVHTSNRLNKEDQYRVPIQKNGLGWAGSISWECRDTLMCAGKSCGKHSILCRGLLVWATLELETATDWINWSGRLALWLAYYYHFLIVSAAVTKVIFQNKLFHISHSISHKLALSRN